MADKSRKQRTISKYVHVSNKLIRATQEILKKRLKGSLKILSLISNPYIWFVIRQPFSTSIHFENKTSFGTEGIFEALIAKKKLHRYRLFLIFLTVEQTCPTSTLFEKKLSSEPNGSLKTLPLEKYGMILKTNNRPSTSPRFLRK